MARRNKGRGRGKQDSDIEKLEVKTERTPSGNLVTIYKPTTTRVPFTGATKPKKKYTRTRGHRQAYTRVQIDITN